MLFQQALQKLEKKTGSPSYYYFAFGENKALCVHINIE